MLKDLYATCNFITIFVHQTSKKHDYEDIV